MSDLIDRKKALDEISKIDTSIIPSRWVKGYVDETIKETQRIIRTIPSAESVQTSKVIIHKYWFGVSLNVVGEQTIGYEWICENCKKMVVEGDEYCSHCGARLEWE